METHLFACLEGTSEEASGGRLRLDEGITNFTAWDALPGIFVVNKFLRTQTVDITDSEPQTRYIL